MRTTEIWKDGALIESIPYSAEEEAAADALDAQQLAKEKALPDAKAALANLQAAIAAIGKTYNQAQMQAAFNAVLTALDSQLKVDTAFTPELNKEPIV